MEVVNIDEAKQLANYFSDGSPGYILEFNNLEWDLYTKKIVGFRIQERFGGSKGNSFKEFLVSEDISDHLKFKLIYSLNETMKQIASIRQFENPSSYKSPKMNPLVTLLIEEAYHKKDSARLLNGTKFSKEVNLEYIQQLPTRISKDIQNKDFDSVLTKSNTMIDEVLKYIIENTKGKSIDNNTVRSKDLRNQAFERLNIKIDKDMDKRIKALVGALNTLSDKILEMRNSQGDAHAQGSRRIVINEEEAILTANSAMILCEYLFRKYEKRKRFSDAKES
ncbi:abortive infection family protein [Enterococcus faecalis]|nr:abortive infection family protein [Enterococcus faecalis]